MPDTQTLPSTDRLLELIDRFVGRPVLVIADLVADRFITGRPKRISREAPVLILRFESETLIPGGGANAVANVAALGGRPFPIGVVGDDEAGRGLIDAFASRGIATEGILIREGWPTTTKTRVLGGGRHSIKQQIVRFDVEEPRELSALEVEALQARLDAWRLDAGTEVRVAVFSDYGYGAATPDLLSTVRQTLGEAGSVLCDSRYRLDRFQDLSGATPNEEEAEALLGRGLEGDGRRDAEALRQRLGAPFLLITRGSRGMVLTQGAGSATIPVHGTDQVADVTGAGDTVIGTFALALSAGASPLEAALLANYAGGLVVMKMGTATLAPDELRGAIEHNPQLLQEVRWESS